MCPKNLDEAFRRVKKNDKEIFGNIHVLFVGDCFQLGPVGSTMIHQFSAKIGTKYLTQIFLETFLTVFILTEQVRYKNSSGLIDLARAIRSDDFKQKHVDFLNHRIGKVEDIDFTKAVVLVATRLEKKQFLKQFYLQMSKISGESCIAWRAGISDSESLSESQMEKLCESIMTTYSRPRAAINNHTTRLSKASPCSEKASLSIARTTL